MSDDLLDLYSDYLIVENRYATATGLSASLDQRISHDKITRFLSAKEYDSKALWGIVKKKVRELEQGNGVIIFDDTLSEKPHSEQGSIVNWHFDHSKGRSMKGINILNMLLSSSLGHPKFQKFGIVLAGFAALCWARRVVILLIWNKAM